MPFNDTSETVAWRADVAEQNEVLAQYDISLPTDGLSEDLLWTYRLDFPTHHFAGEMYYRIFNNGWHLGGRFYGPLWQRLPKVCALKF